MRRLERFLESFPYRDPQELLPSRKSRDGKRDYEMDHVSRRYKNWDQKRENWIYKENLQLYN